MATLKAPYLLFIGDAPDRLAAKTAAGIAQWRPGNCVGQSRYPDCKVDLGLPDLDPAQAKAKGAETMVIGVANRGGVIGKAWIETIIGALEAGLDVAAGLHDRLSDVAELAEAARRTGRALHDVRHPGQDLTVATGEPRSGKRLLAVGTDCSVGKMYTTLAIEAEMKARGWNSDFRATGQTGILICAEGISVDAVVADFISGTAEMLSPANSPDHWDVIEGQGSLFHPSFAGVSLGLLHGSQPTHMVLCHEPNRDHMRGLPGRVPPTIKETMDANLQAARLTSDNPVFCGIALNTSALDEAKALAVCDDLSREFGLPAVDPVRHGVAAIVDELAK